MGDTHMEGKEVGPYRVLEKVGQGGMGVVYKAIHTKLDQDVAIKVLSPEFSRDSSMRDRFVREAKIQVKLSHPNVVNILNYLEEGGEVFLIMEYVNGETLESRLKRVGTFQIEKAIPICLKVLEALDFMHSKGVIHRDIKPSNIMFTDSGVVKVTDFGIAKVLGEKGHTRTGMRIGTLWYMSPEQIRGEEATIASDIYSFGVTLYQMVTGRVPFSGDSEYTIMKGHLEERPIPPWEINGNVSKELGRVILKALAKNPKDRFQNVGEFIEDLRKAVIKKPEEEKIEPQVPMKARSLKIPSIHLDKRQSLITLLGLGIIIVIVLFFIFRGKKPETNKVNFPLSVISPSTIIDPTQTKLNTSFEVGPPDNKGLEEPSKEATPSQETTESKETKKQERLSEVPVEEPEKEVPDTEKEEPASKKQTTPRRSSGWGIRK